MEDNEIIIESIEDLYDLIDHMPENTVLEIDLGEEDDDDG